MAPGNDGPQPVTYGSLPEHVDSTSTVNSLDLEKAATVATTATSQGDLTSRIDAFNSQRKEERLRMYSYVVWVFKLQLFCGQFLFVVALTFTRVLNMKVVGYVIIIFAMFNTSSSIVVLSTCPHDLLSLDAMARRMPKMVAGLSAALALVPLMRVLSVFPHMDAILVIVCIFTATSTWSRCASWWPATTTCMTLYNMFYLLCRAGEYYFPERTVHELPDAVHYGIAGWYTLMALIQFCAWQRRIRYSEDKTLARGMAFYEAFYASIVAEGMNWFVTGVTQMLSEVAVIGALSVVIGTALLTPPIVLLILGRTRLFRLIGQSFDRDGARLRKDGAFIAELLDNIPVNVGQLWWVHRETEDESYARFDPRRTWQRGFVTEVVNEKEFLVQVKGDDPREDSASTALRTGGSRRPSGALRVSMSLAPPIKLQFPSMNGGKRMEDLLLQAQNGLRCVDFESLTPDLMRREDSRNKPELQAKWYGLSRPVKSGEQIDYFMSNSWYDNPDTKWAKLCEVAEDFRRKNGRHPTIWLDKLCIDQTAITDGLKVLPVNVMACRKLLALCGDTYLSRLWCIWELFTLFAFVPESVALEKIKFVFLGDYGEGVEMLKGMSGFHVKDAHCYDPNEEARLRQVIDAVGTDRFNKRVAGMAKLTAVKLQKRPGRSTSWMKSSKSGTDSTTVDEGVAV